MMDKISPNIWQLGISDNCLFFIDESKVNLDDLINAEPGSIIRCLGNPNECVKMIDVDVHYEHLAGQDSEEP